VASGQHDPELLFEGRARVAAALDLGGDGSQIVRVHALGKAS
jgi:hypothetical protein